MVWILVSAVSAGAGFAVPTFLSGKAHSPGHDAQTVDEDKEAASRSAEVAFPAVNVNLNEGTLTRYLRLKFSLQVNAADEKKVTDAVEDKRLLLQSWLLSHLADKQIAEIRGTAGQNMVRREILEKFNSFLFADGYDRVTDVLFEEFNVQ
jgi:flagellar basal body-associated protein FliL